MKKAVQIILVTMLILFFVVTGVVAFFIHSLPSMKSVSQMLSPSSQKPAVASSAAAVQTKNEISSSVSTDTTPLSPADSAANASTSQSGDSSRLDRTGIDSLTDPNTPLVDFCQHLGRAQSGAMVPSEFNKAFKESLSGQSYDPRIQAMQPLLKSIFRQPRLQELLYEAQAATESGDENFWQKAAFYSKAALAFQEMISNKKDFEAIGDRTYLMLKMNDLMARKPDLLKDSRWMDYCQSNERSLNQLEFFSFETEKSNFLRLLSESGVSAADIGFNQQYRTVFDILFDGKSLQLKGGWLEELIKPPTPSSDLEKKN